MANKKETKKPSEKTKPQNQSNTLLIVTLVLVIFQLIVLFGMVIGFEGKLSKTSEKIDTISQKIESIDKFFTENVQGYNSGSLGSQQPSEDTSSTNSAEIDIENEPSIGNPEASVIIVEFSDYECPFCQRFFSESYHQLKEEYIDTGKILFVYKDFPLESIHPRALPAAVSANCVYEQLGDEKYFEYHETIFENQRSLTDSNLKNWAIDLGVSEPQYDSCTQNPETTSEVRADLQEGAELGVTGTPSFFINGNLIVGAQPYSVIKQAIEAELNS